MTPEEILRILREVQRLKEVDRAGWKYRGVKSPESVADHSLGVAYLVMAMAGEDIDVAKALKMAMLHDLPESQVGDISFHSPKFKDKLKLEQGAAEEILKDVSDYHDLWVEYSKGESPEAKVVKAADKLELLAQALDYEQKGYDVSDFWDEEYQFSGVSKEIYQSIKKARKERS